ncbi:MAG: D-alanine--D-alanine ligase family protein [Silvibacterium sp.]
MKKLRVGVLFGGRSGEHEVSLLSAASVLKAIDRKKYEVTSIGITKEGRWVTATDAQRLLAGETAPASSRLRAGDPEATAPAAVLARGESVIVPPVPSETKTGALIPFETDTRTVDIQAGAAGPGTSSSVLSLDVILPVLHGTFGEDGTIQGLFELAGIAYVGSGVLGSATGMDKDVMKRLFAAAKLPIPKHVSFLRADWEAGHRKTIAKVEAALRYPIFVKPANLGSSVGITKAHDRKELGPAIDLAASYDRKIVVEQGVGGKGGKARELEVAVLGNDHPEASVVGEIVPSKEFYDYEAKYLSEGSDLIIPAKLTKAQTKRVQQMAIAAFRACDCSGLARVDFLMEPTSSSGKAGRIYLNEINTMPGFTSISMYPKLWAASGVAYPELIDRLIALALERRAEKDRTSYSR